MTTHHHTLYTPELNRLHAELDALALILAHSALPAEEHLAATERITTCHAATDALAQACNLTHDYYRAACADRDATHTELRSALTRLRVLTGATTPRRLPAVLRLLAAAALGALITYLTLTA